ncbi:E3 ubiquitin-protein ligase APD2-like [Punica granatum]|uniref:E3 ubiquitin-protein ligase APD2-like n=2 Tax=Punica granatum TaxID=22663 RepID=A0A6P8DW69_PUNGR|nr:E3 ubiquitin-protein ligase APD2-like [Punica granatum]PKI51464.1 hypothetical protein CRG98_028175 [Punica granatum]
MAERGESSASSSREEPSPASAASSSPSSSVQVHEEEGDERGGIEPQGGDFRQHELEQQQIGINYRRNFTVVDDAAAAIRDDTWSCIIVVLTFWFFVSMTLILGVYGSVSLRLGPNSSILLRPTPIFVQSLKVEELDDTKPGPQLYGFYKSPALDVLSNWSEAYNASVPADSHKEWVFYLNEGSQINISYSVTTPGSSLFLVIAEGNEGLAQWLEDPTYPNTTLSWNVIHGAGSVHQQIYTSANYYIAVGNLNTETIEVELDLQLEAYLYNTTQAYYKCTFSRGQCNLNILFPTGNAAIITTPGPGQGTPGDEWYVKLSYGPRWVTYILGIGGLTVLMLAAFNFLNKFRIAHENRGGAQYGQMDSTRAPLLSYKDDDISSWGSSFDSASQDEADLEEFLSQEGKLKEGENGNNTRRLCAICFDAPRDCFFLPCGHCVACFECGTRIVEAGGTCPVCQRNMKKVRKIFTV